MGKTAIVWHLTEVLRGEGMCVRVNLSATTTTDQLFGSFMPQSDDRNIRTFKWVDGPITKALRSHKTILLDEINLARPDVLDRLAPLLARGEGVSVLIPGSSETISLGSGGERVQVVATMNPSTIGGGRAKLPRSIANQFLHVCLSEASMEELDLISINMFFPAVTAKYMREDDRKMIGTLHKFLDKTFVENGGAGGRGGGPAGATRDSRVNLRDLAKVRALIVGNMGDQLTIFRRENDITGGGKERTPAEYQFISRVIAGLLKVVYAYRFSDQQSRQSVVDVIDRCAAEKRARTRITLRCV